MQTLNVDMALERILRTDRSYHPDAYRFVCEALEVAVRHFNKPREGSRRHLTARELLEGVRRHALKEYGPLASTVLASWGVRETMDVGRMVFRLVDEGVLGKTDDDRIDDFRDVFKLHDVLRAPFLGRTAPCTTTHKDP